MEKTDADAAQLGRATIWKGRIVALGWAVRYVYLRDEVGVSEGRDMLDRGATFCIIIYEN